MIPLLALGPAYRASILAGLFVLIIMLLLGLWVAVKWGGPLQRSVYYMNLSDVNRLRAGTPVVVAGYNVGSVRDIKPLHKDFLADEPSGQPARFLVSLAIDRDWVIRGNSYARLEKPSLLGAPVVTLYLGDGELIEPGKPQHAIEFIPVVELADQTRSMLAIIEQIVRGAGPQIQGILAETQQLIGQQLPETLERLTIEVEATTQPLAQTVERINRLVKGLAEQDAAKIRGIVDEIQRASMQLTGLLGDARGLVGQVRKTTQGLNSTVAKTGPALSAAAGDLEYTLRLTADRLPGILDNLERTTQDLSGLLGDLRANPVGALRGRGTQAPVWTGPQQR